MQGRLNITWKEHRMGTEIYGHFDSKFGRVADTLAASVDEGNDLGASFAVSVAGEMVVDIWAGHLDEPRTRPWQEDTIVNVYSTTKTMSFLCALKLADRDELNFDQNVAEYWPEFAQNGKEAVKVWHLMNHAAGLSGLDEPVTTSDLYDWDKITTLLAAQKPWWEPGSATGYHALTQGYLIGEVVRRISGKTIGQFFQDEIAGPLDADFFIGVPDSAFPRIGNLIPPRGSESIAVPGEPDSIGVRTFRNPAASARESATDAWRRAEIPAANGHGNARSVAKIQAVLAGKGQTNGVRLLSKATAESVMKERIRGIDLALGAPIGFGLGFGLNSKDMPLAPNPNVCFWGGWGGSVVIIDQDAQMSCAYVMNKMHSGLMGDRRSGALVGDVYAALSGQ
jgi:CubicO group peptidase (beta-lactamase class C family)